MQLVSFILDFGMELDTAIQDFKKNGTY